MLQLLVNDYSRDNLITYENVGSYLVMIRDPSNRTLMLRIIDGVDKDYEVANQKMRRTINDIVNNPNARVMIERCKHQLVANKTHPIRRKKVVAVEDTVATTDADDFGVKVEALMEEIAKHYALAGDVASFKITIKTSTGDKLKYTVLGD